MTLPLPAELLWATRLKCHECCRSLNFTMTRSAPCWNTSAPMNSWDCSHATSVSLSRPEQVLVGLGLSSLRTCASTSANRLRMCCSGQHKMLHPQDACNRQLLTAALRCNVSSAALTNPGAANPTVLVQSGLASSPRSSAQAPAPAGPPLTLQRPSPMHLLPCLQQRRVRSPASAGLSIQFAVPVLCTCWPVS